MARFSVDKELGRVWIDVPFKLKDSFCKAIPSAEWDPNARSWWALATPWVAIRMMDLARDRFPALARAPGFDALAALANKLVTAERIRTPGARLKPIPRTKMAPWDHQLVAYWVARTLPGSLLGMDMGTGKSKVFIDVMVNTGARLALVIAPPYVTDRTWPEQIEKHLVDDWGGIALILGSKELRGREHGHEALRTAFGGVRKKADALQEWMERCARDGRPLLAVVNYESAWRPPLGPEYETYKGRDGKDRQRRVSTGLVLQQMWDVVGLDEGHNIKKPGGKASWFCADLRSRARKRMDLTGTPLAHSKLDAYAQYRAIDPGVYGTNYSAHKQEFAIEGGSSGHEVVRWINEDEFTRRFHSIAYIVDADDCQDLPPEQHITRTFSLCDYARGVYDDLETQMVAELESGEVTPDNALVRLLRFQQITAGHVTDDDGMVSRVCTGKRDLLRELLQDFRRDERVVVFSMFKPDLEQIHEAAAHRDVKRPSFEFSGQRKELDRWIKTPGAVIAVQARSGKEGLNDLVLARYGVFYSPGFSLGAFRQMKKRIRRPGQERPVIYYYLVASGTIDERVYQSLHSHAAEVDGVVKSVLASFRGDHGL